MFESSFAHLTSNIPLEWTGRHQGSSCALISLPPSKGQRSADISWAQRDRALLAGT